MSSKIRLLSETTINQIAAGEVIENPGSVVKELLENAVDAAATKVVIEIQGGGLQLIRISDNGFGMSKDDALLSLERHATSKIKDAKDLFRIQTMGFRGEALASIASISQMSLLTSDGAGATKVDIDGGKVRSVQPAARNQGTTIEVRNLFYNVPARKKFQKPPALCSSEISRIVTLISLSYPGIGFEMYAQDKLVFAAQARLGALWREQVENRIEEGLGKTFLAKSFYLESEESGIRVRGFVGSPENTRHNRSGQYLFINGRAVISPIISYAVRDAFGTRLSSDRHPVYVLYIDIPHDRIDVNVHPQKREVRLKEEESLKAALQKIIQSSLQSGQKSFPAEESVPGSFSFKDFSFSKRKEEPFYTESYPSSLKAESMNTEPSWSFDLQPIGLYSYYLILDAESAKDRVHAAKEVEGGIFLVDLKAATARLLFDQIVSAKVNAAKQMLLFPLSFSFADHESERLCFHIPFLEKMGFEIRPVGGSAFIVDAIPPFVEEGDVKKILESFLEEKYADEYEDYEAKSQRRFAEVASRFARAHKRQFMLQEAVALVGELLRSSAPYECPNGHKTIAYLSEKNVDSFFAVKKR